MKKITKLLAFALICFCASTVNAKNISLPANATDTDVASALNQAETGDIIVVNGWVTMNATVEITKNVLFTLAAGKEQGDGGFDGGGVCRLFNFNPEPIDGESLVFENLGFENGFTDTEDGGCGRILGGVVEFRMCYFSNNYAINGGAIYIANAPIVKFRGCDFDGNNTRDKGGAVRTVGAPEVRFDYCHLSGNHTYQDRGGALFFEGSGQYYFYYCKLDSNWSGWEDDNHGQEGHQYVAESGGGVLCTAGAVAITFENCGLVNNMTKGNHGGLYFLMSTPNLTFINCTVAGNVTRHGRGVGSNQGGAVITFVNTTWATNSGDNSGNGGGAIDQWSGAASAPLYIFNSLFVGNICNTGEGAVDIKSGGEACPANWVFKNSIVGLINGSGVGTEPWTVQDNPNISQKSDINMYKLGTEEVQPSWNELDYSGINFVDGIQTTNSFRMPYITLKTGDVVAAKLGDPALLADYDIDVDQLEGKRAIVDNAVFAGAVQKVTGDAKATDTGWEANIPLEGNSGICTPKVTAVKGVTVIGIVENGILAVDFGSLSGIATGKLYSLNGKLVENVFKRNVIGKGYYDLKAEPGIYILKVDIKGNTYATQVVVK